MKKEAVWSEFRKGLSFNGFQYVSINEKKEFETAVGFDPNQYGKVIIDYDHREESYKVKFSNLWRCKGIEQTFTITPIMDNIGVGYKVEEVSYDQTNQLLKFTLWRYGVNNTIEDGYELNIDLKKPIEEQKFNKDAVEITLHKKL